MATWLLVLLVSVSLCFAAPEKRENEVVVVSYNILCSVCAWDNGYSRWSTRLPHLEELVAYYNPDVFGLQELVFEWEAKNFSQVLPNITAVYYKGPPLDRIAYVDTPVFFRNDMFDLIDSGFLWLGPYPTIPWSPGFYSPLPRTFVWTILRQKSTGLEFFFSNTHYDNTGNSRVESAELVLNFTQSFRQNYTLILVGDWNSGITHGSRESYEMMIAGGFINTHDIAQTVRIDTNPGIPAPPDDPDDRIDHIFTTSNQTVVYEWWENEFTYPPHSMPPSDHYPVGARISI